MLFAVMQVVASGFVAQAEMRQLHGVKPHTSKKVDPAPTRIAYHGSTVWSTEGRLYFADKNSPPVVTPTRARVPKNTQNTNTQNAH